MFATIQRRKNTQLITEIIRQMAETLLGRSLYAMNKIMVNLKETDPKIIGRGKTKKHRKCLGIKEL